MSGAHADVFALLEEICSSKGTEQEEFTAWDLRCATASSARAQSKQIKVLSVGGNPKSFLEARSASGEQAAAIIIGTEPADSNPSALYRQVLVDGLLQRRGLILLQGLDRVELLAKMVRMDVASGLLDRVPSKSESSADAVQLSEMWLPGVPMPSMSIALAQEDEIEGLAPDGLKRRRAEKAEASPKSPTSSSAVAPAGRSLMDSLKARARTLAAISLLWGCAPMLMLIAGAAWLRHKLFGPSFQPGKPKKQLRILVTGGKMSKASAVARAVGRDGHKVFTAEIMPYKYCHTRFCSYVTKHYVLPRPTVDPVAWEAAVQAIVAEQSIDLIIPCTAPVESSAYAHLRERLPPHVRVFAFDGAVSDELDNKYTFNQVLVKADLACPETAAMECLEDGLEFFRGKSAADGGKKYIVKPAVYDPKARTEILFLPIEDEQRQEEYLRSRNATKEVPYVIQEVLQNPEYGCFAMFNKGALTGFEFFESAASCLVYRQCRDKRYQQVLELNKGLGKAMNLTGQLTLDLMHTASGDMVPIECNPRIHSAICTLEGHRNLGSCYTEPDHAPSSDADIVLSKPDTFRFWIMDQIFLMAGFWKHKSCFKLSISEMLGGNDAMLAGDDPMPFLAMYLAQIPSLLALEILPGTEWLKLDFCIGKVVKEGGD
uniref:ATP-grasp domain-containing protein n=1 Tax=Alexandrium andersonii TaxID=327968 RepID=A0A7S2C8A8_9DINO|mmetsp:Transcript_35453/g.80551  ORF Transcript_35453/g.80551 Transcript_35453/m.80551 type:complete len:658 (+) Transcript_35453:73-2046(+)